MAESQHGLCLTFLLHLIPLTILFSWEDLMVGWGLLGRHLTGSNRISLEGARGLSLTIVCPPKLITLFEVSQREVLGPVIFVLYTTPPTSISSGRATPPHLYEDSQPYVVLHQTTLLQHWIVYKCYWPLSSLGCWRINWKWIQTKLNSPLWGTNDSGGYISWCSLLME